MSQEGECAAPSSFVGGDRIAIDRVSPVIANSADPIFAMVDGFGAGWLGTCHPCPGWPT
jgi:hypothetical protein